jgi:hypothetical protein
LTSSAKGLLALLLALSAEPCTAADSDPAHVSGDCSKPIAWPDGIVPYDVSKLEEGQRTTVRQAMQRWMDTGARIAFVPRTSQTAYVSFTGRTDAGNNTSQTGFKPETRIDINITAFWWRQGEWMPAHEFGHVLGFHHEHARWDRDAYVSIHYENLKPERRSDYDWIPKTNWLVSSTSYDYYSIMHYRICWSSACESRCRDAEGTSPCTVIEPREKFYDRVVGQWTDNGLSLLDGEKARRAYGSAPSIYVGPGSANEGGVGTLENPYASLVQARRSGLMNARYIVLSDDGNFSLAQ